MSKALDIINAIETYMNTLKSQGKIGSFYKLKKKIPEDTYALPSVEILYSKIEKSEGTTRSQEAVMSVELLIKVNADDDLTALQTVHDEIEKILPKNLGSNDLGIIRLNVSSENRVSDEGTKGQIGTGICTIDIVYRHLIQTP